MTSDLTDLSTIRLAGGPAAWRGSEIQQCDTYTYELTRFDIQELDAALRHAVSQELNPAKISREQFPLGQLGVSLKTIGQQLESGIGFCLIRGIPIERYSVLEAGVILCGIGAHFGRQMPQNGKGEVLNHVRDAGLAATRGQHARGYQSGLELPFHSDSCDIVGLLCLCDAKSGGLSTIVSSYAIHNAIFSERPDLLRSLYQPFHIDRHGENPRGVPPYYSTPVFMWHKGRLFSRFNPGYVYSAQRYAETPRLTNQQMDAIEIFNRLCASNQFRLDMKLKPGDLQLLNNNVVVHCRSAYQDYAETAKKRHLLRLWLFTSGINDIPVPMRDRYREMEAWQVNVHVPSQFV
jgi:hypothetical protein